MQKILRLLLLSTLLLGWDFELYSQSSFVINGATPQRFENAEASLYRFVNKERTITSIKNGAFSFSGNLEQEYEKVYLDIRQGSEPLWSFTFFVQPGNSEVSIDSSVAGDQIGSAARFINIPFLKEQRDYQQTVVSIEDSARKIFNLLRYAKKVKTTSLDTNYLQEVYDRLYIEEKKRRIDFIKENASSYYALTIFEERVMYDFLISTDSLSALFSVFDPSLRKTQLGGKVSEYFDILKSLSIGRKMPDFWFRSSDHKLYRVSELNRSGLALIGFWHSGCAPCIRHIPHIREIAKTYAAKGLQLLWISTDLQEATWRRRLESLPMPWLQTCDIEAYRDTTSLKSLYNISYSPQYFLIDKQGVLIYHNVQSVQLGYDDDLTVLEEVLKEYFNK
ncbi:MAG TPA: TlpA disulfide reductase family protein [Flavitalea sp.]|nr:TlpA disulfide reductase family protein [Flavitalea sp.]